MNKELSCVVTLKPDTLDALVKMYTEINPDSEPLKVGTNKFETFVNDVVGLCKMKEDHITKLKRRIDLLESSLNYTKGVLQRQGQVHANIYYVKDREIMDLKMRVSTLEKENMSLKDEIDDWIDPADELIDPIAQADIDYFNSKDD